MNRKLEELVIASTNRINNGDYKFFWQADDFKFDNKHLTAWYEKETGSFAHFVCSELDQIRQVLDDKLLDMNFDYNADYLKYLRAKYDKLQLFFSGGYDSVCILQTAINNGIKIDETLTCVVGDLQDPCNQEIRELAIPYLEKNKKHITKHIFLNNTWDMLTEYFANEYRFFIGSGNTAFPLSFGNLSIEVCKQPYNPNSIYIQGADKPQLVFYNNKWYACCLDTTLNDCLDIPNVSFFWLNAKNIKSLIKDARLYRKHVITKTPPKNNLAFYKASHDREANKVLNRHPIINHNKLLLKNLSNEPVVRKHKQRFLDAVENDKYQLLTNYFTCVKTYKDVLHYDSVDSIQQINNFGKFCWFIDIDSLEVFTQQELIPNGFKFSLDI